MSGEHAGGGRGRRRPPTIVVGPTRLLRAIYFSRVHTHTGRLNGARVERLRGSVLRLGGGRGRRRRGDDNSRGACAYEILVKTKQTKSFSFALSHASQRNYIGIRVLYREYTEAIELSEIPSRRLDNEQAVPETAARTLTKKLYRRSNISASAITTKRSARPGAPRWYRKQNYARDERVNVSPCIKRFPRPSKGDSLVRHSMAAKNKRVAVLKVHIDLGNRFWNSERLTIQSTSRLLPARNRFPLKEQGNFGNCLPRFPDPAPFCFALKIRH